MVMTRPLVMMITRNHRIDYIGELIINVASEMNNNDDDPPPIVIEDDVWIGS